MMFIVWSGTLFKCCLDFVLYVISCHDYQRMAIDSPWIWCDLRISFPYGYFTRLCAPDGSDM